MPKIATGSRLVGGTTIMLMLTLAHITCRQTPATSKSNVVDINRQVEAVTKGMTRGEVIALLGPADWAGLTSDSGDFGVKDPDTAFILYWRNPGFPVVAIHFDADNAVRWDRGWFRENTYHHLFEPTAAYGCDQPDRKAFCR